MFKLFFTRHACFEENVQKLLYPEIALWKLGSLTDHENVLNELTFDRFFAFLICFELAIKRDWIVEISKYPQNNVLRSQINSH